MISVMGTDYVDLGEHFLINDLIELQNISKLKILFKNQSNI